MSNRLEMTRLLRAVGKMIDGMTEEEYERFLNGELQLNFVQARKRNTEPIKKITPEDVQLLITQLWEMKARDEARSLLQSDIRLQLKGNLMTLAKALKIHITKQDKREDIEAKIVEFVIGARLRSEAIQGISFASRGS